MKYCYTRASGSKYGNKKVIVDGYKFDSIHEAQRYGELKMLEKAGKISELELQKKYVLIPAQYEAISSEEFVRGEEQKKRGKLIERECAYYADFAYIDNDTDTLIIEDTKSEATKTDDYIIKRKLMLYLFGIRVREV